MRALQDAVAPEDGSRGADVLVTSWGILDEPGVPATDYDRTMATIAAAGAVVVAAAGNDGARDGGETIAVPAQLPDVIAAGGVDRSFRWHPKASAGPSPRTGLPKPDVAAPVVDIRSTSLGGGAADTTGGPDGGFAGTSAAAPIVASLVALLTQAVHDRGQASPDIDEVRAALPLLTRDVDRPGPDERTGLGVVDAWHIDEAADALVAARRR
jgi:subtilisin family serine protease